MTYLRDHWRGDHPLPRAFWINFLIPFVLIAMAEPWVRPDPGTAIKHGVLALLYILVTHAVILPWQVVGLWRSLRRHLRERGDLMTVTFAQLAIVVALITAAGATITTVQRVFGFGQAVPDRAEAAPSYLLRVHAEDRAISIDGAFGTGLSRDLKTLMATTSGIDTIVLNSDGGRVFEARGVAKQIVANALDTHVDAHCRSACTIAYVAGRTRTLGAGGRLGFHSYRMDGVAFLTDPLEEQEKDRVFFLGQGVEPGFVDHAFATPHDDMWHPETDHLLRARVVHRVLAGRHP